MPRRRSSPSARRVACWLRSGSSSSIVLWARCSALETAAAEVSSASAISAGAKPSTSRRISAARWRAGRCWSAATNAELDALALLVAGLRAGAPVRDPRHPVGQRLEPDRLGQRLAGRAVRVRRRPVVDRQHPLRPPLDQPQAAVRRDPVQPAAQRAAALEAGEPAPAAQQRLLERVLGVVQRAEHPVAVRVQLGAVGRDQVLERALVAAARRLRASGGRGRSRGSLGLRPGGGPESIGRCRDL